MTKLTRRSALRLGMAAAAVPFASTSARADGHATVHQVLIKNFAFEPADLTINAGDSVEFINEDSAPHTATADNGSFDTGNLRRGQKATLTFATAGTYSYFCAVHPRMKGSLTVN